MRGWIDEARVFREETCPACGKPLLFAANNPEKSKACSDPECVHAHGLPEYRIGLDLPLNAPPVVTVAQKLPDGGLRFISPEDDRPTFGQIIHDVVHARLIERNKRHEAFLREVLRVTDPEYQALMGNLQPLVGSGVYVGGRGHGKKLRAEVAERIIKRMEENPLPDNFWTSVAAYRMLEDPEGRRLVKAIVDKKLGCEREAGE